MRSSTSGKPRGADAGHRRRRRRSRCCRGSGSPSATSSQKAAALALVGHPHAAGVDDALARRRAARTGGGCGRRRRAAPARRRASARGAPRGVSAVMISSSLRGEPWQYSAPSSATTSSKPASRSRCARVMRAAVKASARAAGSSAVDGVVGVAAIEAVDHLAVGVAAHPAHAAGRAPPGGRGPRAGIGPDDDVAADDDRVGAGEGVVGEHRLERGQVAVDVVERGDDAHTEGPTARRRLLLAARLVGQAVPLLDLAPLDADGAARRAAHAGAAVAARALGEPEGDDRVRAGAAHLGRHRAARAATC